MESVKVEQLSQNTPRKRYDPEFIQQVLGVYQSDVYATIEDCAIAYNISNKTLGGWIAKYKKNSSPKQRYLILRKN